MVQPHSRRLNLPIAPAGAIAAASLTALVFVAMPASLLDSLVVASGAPSALGAAQPPLGWTARACLALLTGSAIGLIAWAALFLAVGPRRVLIRLPVRRPRAAGVPAVRRADAHPDAPPRPPILAERDLGTPFLDVHAPEEERPLPVDLTTPLAAVDPRAILPVPREPVRPVPPSGRPPRL